MPEPPASPSPNTVADVAAGAPAGSAARGLAEVYDRRRILLVSGLSGAGKSSILRILEDLGHQAVDNPPLSTLDEIIAGSRGPMAIGVDARTTGFDAGAVLDALSRLRRDPGLWPELLFAVAEESVLLRRFTATRRRHPLARGGRVADGIAAEQALTEPLRAQADLVIDTSDLPPPELRRLVESRYGATGGQASQSLTVSLVSFAFPAGLPRESDMVFDARFLRNPFYDPILSSMTGLDRPVVEHMEADPDYFEFLDSVEQLLRLVLPRFVTEGKKYATIAIGCSGGRHRSVALVEALAVRLGLPRPSGEASGAGGSGPEHATGDGCGHTGDRNVYETQFNAQAGGPSNARYPIIVMHRELLRSGRSQ